MYSNQDERSSRLDGRKTTWNGEDHVFTFRLTTSDTHCRNIRGLSLVMARKSFTCLAIVRKIGIIGPTSKRS